MFKFYIDNQLTDQPVTDTDLVTTLKRDRELGGFLTTQEVTLTYSANNDLEAGTVSGFTLLKNLFDLGTCREAEIVIYDEQSSTETFRVYTGVIKVPSMQVQEQELSLSCKIEDNSYYAYIKNNKNVKFSLYATTTKNGQIVEPPPIYEIDFFDSYTGVYNSVLGYYYQGYRIYDVLKFLVPALSDNKVSFESDFLRTAVNQLMLFDGAALRQPNTSPNITISFLELTTELFKLKNLGFYIDITDPDAPILRLEPQGWFYAGANGLSFEEPLLVKASVKAEKLYGTIRAGSNYNPGEATFGSHVYTWNKNTSYFGWKDELYTPYGQCNTEAELNLTNDFVIASNAINDTVNGGSTASDDSLFIVECFNLDEILFTGNATAYSFPTTGTTPYYYNMGLNNVQKLQLHGSNFQAALTNTQNAGTNVFRAELGQDLVIVNFNNPGTGNPAITDPVPFADEFSGNNYDPGGNYDNTTNFWYLVPVAGDYSFKASINFELQNTTLNNNGAIFELPSGGALSTQIALGIELLVDIIAYQDATLSVVLFQSVGSLVTYTDGTYIVNAALVAQLPVGAVVRVTTVGSKKQFAPLIYGLTPLDQVGWAVVGLFATPPNGQDIRGIALEDSFFECNGTPEGALVPAQPDATLFKSKLLEFEYDLTTEQFRDIVAFPIGSFEIIKDSISRIGWIEELKHNHQSGLTTIKLITQDATT